MGTEKVLIAVQAKNCSCSGTSLDLKIRKQHRDGGVGGRRRGEGGISLRRAEVIR